MSPAWLLMMVAGCAPEIVLIVDLDDDGSPLPDDCDDTNPDVNPQASERCNGMDDDCDGLTDDDDDSLAVDEGVTWYADADGDGHANADASRVGCVALPGELSEGGDCNDTDDSVFPGAAEVCDGIDQDCDGSIDEDALDAFVWLVDSDGDGFGGGIAVAVACDAPAATTAAIGGDCDDGDGSVNPSAQEVCSGRDDDCDGLIDDEDDSVDPATLETWFVDVDGDGSGGATTGQACAASPPFAASSDDCDDSNALVHPAAPELCNDIDDDCDGLVDDADGSVQQSSQTKFFSDRDADSYGDQRFEVYRCVIEQGLSMDGDDCDDTQEDVHPGGTEVCDQRDNDCNGATDDDDSALIDGPSAWLDADGDGFGRTEDERIRCVVGSDESRVPGDCDDGNAAINPAAVEVCETGVDENCDGSPGPCGGRAPMDAAASWPLQDRGQFFPYGFGIMGAGDLDGDGRGDLLRPRVTSTEGEVLSFDSTGAVSTLPIPVLSDVPTWIDADDDGVLELVVPIGDPALRTTLLVAEHPSGTVVERLNAWAAGDPVEGISAWPALETPCAIVPGHGSDDGVVGVRVGRSGPNYTTCSAGGQLIVGSLNGLDADPFESPNATVTTQYPWHGISDLRRASPLVDLDGDGLTDLVMRGTEGGGLRMAVRLGPLSGPYEFTAETPADLTTTPASSMAPLAWSDFDGDGRMELLSRTKDRLMTTSGAVSLFDVHAVEPDGSGWKARLTSILGTDSGVSSYMQAAIEDFDGDEIGDIAVVLDLGGGEGMLHILHGPFNPEHTFESGSASSSPWLAPSFAPTSDPSQQYFDALLVAGPAPDSRGHDLFAIGQSGDRGVILLPGGGL